jgi:hypothetical protein
MEERHRDAYQVSDSKGEKPRLSWRAELKGVGSG